jgi:hypothetical protein
MSLTVSNIRTVSCLSNLVKDISYTPIVCSYVHDLPPYHIHMLIINGPLFTAVKLFAWPPSYYFTSQKFITLLIAAYFT